MASPYKTSKAELVAIYRLEFYKKQKSWKYCSQERKKEEEKRRAARNALREKLNQTYEIGPAPEKDADPVDKEADPVDEEADLVDKEADELKDLSLAGLEEKQEQESKELDVEEESAATPPEDKVDDLNEAFVDTETDDSAILPTQLDSSTYPYSPKWSIQYWAAQRRRLWKQQDQPSCPNPDSQDYPEEASAYPTQDTQPNPSLDSQKYPSQVTQVYPIENAPIYPQDTQVYLAQQTQLYPAEESPNYKQITQVYPTPKCQVYPIEPNQSNLYSPEMPYRADLSNFSPALPNFSPALPKFSPALPQCGASLDTSEAHQYGVYEREGWPRQSQVWTRHEWDEGMEECGWGAGRAAGDAVDAPAGVLGRAQRWLSSSHQSETTGCESVLSVSSESFSRGAALAPHSSEIDLRISSSSEELAAGLSSSALSAAVARHAGALQALLGEAKKRDLVSPPIDMHSFEEYPTRDVPTCPTRDVPSCPTSSDVIIAGSFQYKPDLSGQTDPGPSRGRGKRLRDAAIIGIGRGGRPYRI